MRRMVKTSLLTAALVSMIACSPKEDQSSTAGAPVTLNAVAVGSNSSFSVQNIGANTVSGLKSLKYMISSIQICNSLEVSGTAFTNAAGCATLYTGAIPGSLADSTVAVPFPVFTDMQNGNYADFQIDLMDAASRAKLNVNAALPAGEYHWGVITWAAPIQFNAEIEVAGGTKIYSKATTSASGAHSVTTQDVRTGPSQDGVVASPSGGAFFKMPRPFVVTDADVEAGTGFVIDLVFNPEGVIRATDTSSDLSMTNYFKHATDGGFYVPMLSLTPVPRKAGDTNTKEIYTITDSGGESYRLELYYNTSDAGKAIRGASLIQMSGLVSDDFKIKSIDEVSGKLDFTSTAIAGPGFGPGGALNGFARGAGCGATQIVGVNVASCALDATVVVP